jgi:hypothetical protein
MTAREYCMTHESTAYYSGLGGLEIKGMEYGIDDYIICVAGAWCSKKSYHRVKVSYTAAGRAFIRVHGQRVPLDECIRMGV